MVCAICNQVVEIAIDDTLGWAVHRYFHHGPLEERLLRWGASVLAAVLARKIVQAVAREVA
jgi:hypothetical protein